MWIFGYGSLIWRPGFDYLERQVAFIQGYVRKFYQGSPDHRGTPARPGRVVTLLPSPEATCWGMAYRVSDQIYQETLAQLDHREQGGYERLSLQLHLAQKPKPHPTGLVYIATQNNAHYLGPAPLPAMVEHIRSSNGPSGPNREYLIELHQALARMGREDPHVRELYEALHQAETGG